MVTAFETITTSASSSDGEGTPEWYKILKVEHFSPFDTVEQQYRKLALALRPDKNPYVECEEGFRLVNEAFKILGDKVRRSEYDVKLKIRIESEIGACEGDNLPRSYCVVSEVVSVSPLKVWISWLDYESEKLISWMKNSSCGRFRTCFRRESFDGGACETVLSSCQLRKGCKRSVPDKSQRRRKSRGNEIVVCLSMYSDAYGLSVAYLEKVDDNLFKRRGYGSNEVRWVEKEDVAALLSHQIPAKKLQEDRSGAGGVRENWVLDLSSVPPDLVSVT